MTPGSNSRFLRLLAAARRPPRLLRLASDERLVAHVRGGSEAAFEVSTTATTAASSRFCRHMLGSVEEAEDAVQHTFMAAYRDMLGSDKPIQLRPGSTRSPATAASPCCARAATGDGRARRAADRAPLHRGPAPAGPAGPAARPRRRCPRTSAPRSCSPSSATSRTTRSADVLGCREREGEGARVPGAHLADRQPAGARDLVRGDPRAARDCAAGRCAGPRCAATCASARGAASSASGARQRSALALVLPVVPTSASRPQCSAAARRAAGAAVGRGRREDPHRGRGRGRRHGGREGEKKCRATRRRLRRVCLRERVAARPPRRRPPRPAERARCESSTPAGPVGARAVRRSNRREGHRRRRGRKSVHREGGAKPKVPPKGAHEKKKQAASLPPWLSGRRSRPAGSLPPEAGLSQRRSRP